MIELLYRALESTNISILGDTGQGRDNKKIPDRQYGEWLQVWHLCILFLGENDRNSKTASGHDRRFDISISVTYLKVRT